MALDLTNVHAKLGRSEEYRESVDREVKPWLDGSPYRIDQVMNADGTRHSLIVRANGDQVPPPFQKWTLTIGDCVHNLRSSLDHLIHAIAIRESGQDPPPDEDRLAFPICDTPADFNGFKRKIRTLSIGVRAAIESVQPYNRPNPAIPPFLAVLRDLDITDKHRLLRLAFGTIENGKLGIVGQGNPLCREVRAVVHTGKIEDGTEIAAFIFDCPNPDMKYDRIEVDMIVALTHKQLDPLAHQWTSRSDFSALILLLTDEVKFVIETVTAAVK